jgi:hypothetical protein
MISKTFQLINGITAEAIADSVTVFLQTSKGMITESTTIQDGVFIQAKGTQGA